MDKHLLREQLKRIGGQHHLLNEAGRPPRGALYIARSSTFDSPSNKYDIKLFTKTLKAAGAKKVWTDNEKGWSNQPEVVLFTGLNQSDAEDALDKLPVFKKWGSMVYNAAEDWD